MSSWKVIFALIFRAAEQKAIGLGAPSSDNVDSSDESDNESDDSSDAEDSKKEEEFVALARLDSDGEGEGTLKDIPYIISDPNTEPEGPEPAELTARQRRLRIAKSKARDNQRKTVNSKLEEIGMLFSIGQMLTFISRKRT